MNHIACMRAARKLAIPLALAVLSVATPGCAEMPAEPEAPLIVVAAPEPVPVAVPVPAQVSPPVPAPTPAAEAPKPETALSDAQKANYIGYTGVPWSKDYGVVQGRCNPAAAGEALGAQAGTRSVAILVAGPAGAKLAGAMDERDRACMGHALELVRKGSAAAWSNGGTGLAYRLTMSHDYVHEGLPCREFVAVVTAKAGKDTVKGGACRRPEAKWELQDRN